MDLGDLRGIGLFSTTDDDQLLALRAAGSEVAFECGDVLFQENHPAEAWWVLLDGNIDLVRHVRHEETRLGAMDGARPVGGRVPRVGRARRLPRDRTRHDHRAHAQRPGRCPALVLDRRGSPSACTSSRGCRGRRATTRRWPGRRRPWRPSARWPPASRTSSNNPAAAAARAVDALAEACDEMLASLRRLAAAPVTADQFAALDDAAAGARAAAGRRP